MEQTIGLSQRALAPALALLAAHLLADFPLQPRRWVEQKSPRGGRAPALPGPAAVAGVWGGLGALHGGAGGGAAAVALGHVLFDGLKARRRRDGLGAFLADQGAHLVLLGILALLIAGRGARPIAPSAGLLGLINACLLTWWFEGALVGRATARWRAELGTGGLDARGLPDAGLWIGRLERSLILVFVLIGRIEAVGFLIAAKSVFRFGEVTQPGQRREAEYILVGTMGSFLLALLTGLGARALL